MSSAELTPAVTIVGPEHHTPLEAFLRETSGGCFCQFWHYSDDDYGWLARCASGEENARDFRASQGSPQARGVVALDGETVVGWLKLADTTAMSKLSTRRVYRTLPYLNEPRDDVLAVACMLVSPTARRRGIARTMLEWAIDWARTQGHKAIEAFPRVANHQLRDDELQMGPTGLFDSLGFTAIDGTDLYPVLRLELIPSADRGVR